MREKRGLGGHSWGWAASIVGLAAGATVIFLFLPSPFASPGQRMPSVLKDEVPRDENGRADGFALARGAMVEEQLRSRDINDPRVLEVMGEVPRHHFLAGETAAAYEDHPLPIGYGQTISQPYIVALMTQVLQLKPGDRVLEIGTGSGYQAAVLSRLVKEVYSIEIVPQLADRAASTIRKLGYGNVQMRNADGYHGWREAAPFDAIMVTAAASHIPPPLLDQLREGGRLVIPLGDTLLFQTLTLVTKKGDELDTRFVTGVRFVPMTGKTLEAD